MILSLEKRQIETKFEINQVLDLAEKDFKAIIITMFKEAEENELIMSKNKRSQQKK